MSISGMLAHSPISLGGGRSGARAAHHHHPRDAFEPAARQALVLTVAGVTSHGSLLLFAMCCRWWVCSSRTRAGIASRGALESALRARRGISDERTRIQATVLSTVLAPSESWCSRSRTVRPALHRALLMAFR